MSRRYASAWLVALCGWVAAAVPRGQLGEVRLFSPATYDLETTVLLNDVARQDKEVGYKIVATLDVAPVWSLQPNEFLLSFQLRSPKLHLRGKHVTAEFMPHESVWDKHGDSIFYAHWKNGLIQNTYLDPDELLDVVNYKKSLASLFQFQLLDGEYNETDISGPCTVLYETVSMNVFRKIKRSCSADASGAGAVSGARRVARYTLSAALDALDALFTDELVTLGHDELGLKARAWTRLARRAAPAPPAPAAPAPPALAPAAELAGALRALPGALRPLPLALAPPPDDDAEEELDDEELVAAVTSMSAALEEGGEGGEDGEDEADEAAAALLRALPTLRSASRSRLAALLARDDLHPHLEALCRALGLAGTRAAYGALDELVQLGARDPLLPLARAYLDALALALRPEPWLVREALRLAEHAPSAPVADAALLSAGAAAARLQAEGGAEAEADELAQAVRDALARSLARCKEESCRAVRLTALGNLRRADTADLLLQHAERAEPGPALAALHALRAAPAAAWSGARLQRLSALALHERAPLDVRAAALDELVLRRAPLPAPLAAVAHALHAAGARAHAHELRRVLWQRMRALAPHHEELRRLPDLLEPVLRGWDAQAHAGTSSVLVRHTGWRAAGWSAELESVQLARAGLLRHGAVTLRAAGPGADLDVLGVHVWTRGLEAFGGAEPAAEPAADAPPAEDAAGGLGLSVCGARMRDLTLFDGQAELLGHVWSGAASSPTSVLRALRPLAEERARVPLQAGAWLEARRGAALALALDASAQVSLWYRTARADLQLRAGAALDVRGAVRTAWGATHAQAGVRAAPRLRIGADLDFYSGVSLCVRARTDAHSQRRTVRLRSRLGARRVRVERVRREARRAEGRTLALGRPNDATCRTLRSAESDQPDA